MRVFVSVTLILNAFCVEARAEDAVASIADAVAVLRAVQPGASDSARSRAAVHQLIVGGVKSVMPLLRGFHDANPLAVNWLRNAFEQIADAESKAGRRLPQAELEAFVRDQNNSPIARRLAYETLKGSDPGIEDRLVPEMLLDASPEFRRDAVARLIKEASMLEDPARSTPLFRRAFSGAVHEDQVKTIAEALRKNKEEVDIQKHFGFLPQWSIVGPFDNKDGKGFATAYGPELELAAGNDPDLQAEYDGQMAKVKWQQLSTTDDYGILDIAKQIENYKGSLMYAMTTWTSDKDQQAEIRLGTPNSWKLWVNGKLVFEREEYHRGSQLDQYRAPVALKAGKNTLLFKVCQNEQTQEWAQRYQFQIRICNSTGSAILPATSTAHSEIRTGVQK